MREKKIYKKNKQSVYVIYIIISCFVCSLSLKLPSISTQDAE